ncbi:MAG TPA: hypothetical protein VJN39_07530 [Gemmatimonadales bacterium]|nr:hypothetical protein [Gemmatimonadales bacterium]
MAQLELTADEAHILEQALKTYVSDLRMEIADTDGQDFRDRLKHEESVLTRVLEQLRAG